MFRRSPVNADLVQVPLLEGLSSRELAQVAQLSTPMDFPAGEVLAREGERGNEFLIVLDGSVDVLQNGEVVATRGAGTHLGEIALLGAPRRTASLVATTPVKTRVASRREFRSLLAALPTLSVRLHESMEQRLAA